MKPFRILIRNIRDAFISVIRNFSLSIASISSITITLVVVAISILLTYNVANFTRLVEEDVTIVAFLDKDISKERILEIKDELNKIEGIESYIFESKADILKSMMETSDVFKNIMSNWDENDNPLQDTYLIKVVDLHEIDDVAAQIKDIPNVSLVKYGEGVVQNLIKTFDVIRQISIGIVAALIVVTTFLISNTIKLTIFARKTEISIMRLVGASNITIKIPFIFEGLFLGIIGSVIPIIATVYSYAFLYDNFDGQVFSPFIRLVAPNPFLYVVSLMLLTIGITVGMIGSWWAVRRHLKA
ncbi:MAG: permease-like cell division protein FtsX [Bacilli bacterium]|nr:permease-like cell division protein FtsX [Bacilli bacterium]